MTPDIVADHHSKRGLKFYRSFRVESLAVLAIRHGWPKVQEEYRVDYGSHTLEFFVLDLLRAGQGPFADLLLALADAETARFNAMDDIGKDDDTFPDWWEIREIAEPVAAVMERCLAEMSVLRDGEDAA